MRQQAMRDLGQLGESVFQKWAAEMGLIVNYSKIDKAGWDFLVEFPYAFRGRDAPAQDCTPDGPSLSDQVAVLCLA